MHASPIRQAKHELRRRLRAVPGHCVGVSEVVLASDLWAKASAILLFAPDASEPDLTPLFHVEHARLHAPRVSQDVLEVAQVTASPGGAGWRRGRYELWEPTGDAVDPTCLDLVIVPGVAFARDGRRLGRGGGFYDRLLASLPTVATCGVCCNERLLDDLPTEPHDVRVQAVATPTGLWRS